MPLVFRPFAHSSEDDFDIVSGGLVIGTLVQERVGREQRWPLMRALWDALPGERRGHYAETAAALEPEVVRAIADGDAVMVKGSLGSKMGPIVKALAQRYRRTAEDVSAII